MITENKNSLQVELESMDRQVPYSQEAEISVLGGMLIDRDAIGVAVETLDTQCFYLEAHRKLYKAIVSLYEKSIEVDPVTLPDQLEKEGSLEDVGGRSYILEVFGSVPTAANADRALGGGEVGGGVADCGVAAVHGVLLCSEFFILYPEPGYKWNQ